MNVQKKSQFAMPFFTRYLIAFWRYSQSRHEVAKIFYVFGPIFGRRDRKFLTEFYKCGSPSNMWQRLVTIDRVILEIRLQKRKERSKHPQQNTMAMWPA